MKDHFLSRYTPRIMPAQVLEDIFVQREELAQKLVERIRTSVVTNSPHHTLLIGPRGIGKTHLVSLVYHRIREKADLQDSLLIAWLSEDEWSVTSFLDLLISILRALQEDAENGEGVEALYEMPEEEAEAEGVRLLQELIDNSGTLLLIVENLDDLFAGLGKEGQSSLRAFLDETNCVILATSQCELKEIKQKKSPFYGFFDCERLEDLTAEEATQLLANIARYKGNNQLASFIQTPTGRSRIDAVHFLAGGNPRIYVIFSEFLASQESLDELVGAFMAMLDDLTPYYQERMKNVSPQQRKIVDILVRSGHAITVKDIASRGFMSHQTASSQLKKLLEMSYVRTEQFGREAFYELREPLMRFCLKAKQQRGKPIKLIIDFLRRWYTKSELQRRLELVGGEAKLAREYLLGAIQAFDQDDDNDPRVVACLKEFKDCFEKKDYVSALQQAEKLVAIRDNNALYWRLKGDCLANLKRFEEALASFDKCLEVKPDNNVAWYDRASVLEKLERYEEALASYDKFLEIKPDDDVAWYIRGYALFILKRYKEAVASYDKFLEIKPDDDVAWYIRGYALFNLERFEEAVASFDKSLEIKPDNDEAWYSRGGALFNLGRFEEAVTSYDKAIELGRQSSPIFFNRGICLLSLNRWDEGITSLEEAFNSLEDAENAYTEDAELIIRRLFKNSQDPAIWTPRITSLINLYNKYQAISALGTGLVQTIPMLMSEMVSNKAAQVWQEIWQELGSKYEEFQIPLRLLATAVRYREKRDQRVLLNLPIEERKLLEPLLKNE